MLCSAMSLYSSLSVPPSLATAVCTPTRCTQISGRCDIFTVCPSTPHRHPTAVIKDITFTWTHFLSCCPAAIKPVSKKPLPVPSLLPSLHFRKGSPACKGFFFVFWCSMNDFSDIPNMDTWKVSTNLTWLNSLPAFGPMFTYLIHSTK